MWVLSWFILCYWVLKVFCECGLMMLKIMFMSGSVMSVMRVSCYEIENIIMSILIMVSIEVSVLESDCCIVWVMLLMLFVMWEISLLCCILLKYDSGRWLIFVLMDLCNCYMVCIMMMLIM